jgi:pimeloyl-ACP methyl ester carboxylesterase
MDGTRRDTWVRGVRLASYAVGPANGDVVVVVPGLCVSSYLWPACDALAAEGFRVELVEPPGWPRSARPRPEPDDLAALAGWLTDWLATRDLIDVLVIGQSVGAQLAAHLAGQAPGRVRAVVLQGPVFDPAYRTVLRGLGRWAMDVPRERFALAVREVPEWLRVGPLRVARVLRQSLRDRLEASVAGVTAPVLVVVGEKDTLSERSWQASLRRPVGAPVVMAGVPHSSMHYAPEEFAQLVVEWNAGLGTTAAATGGAEAS